MTIRDSAISQANVQKVDTSEPKTCASLSPELQGGRLFAVTPSPTAKDWIEEFERGEDADHKPVLETLHAFFVPGDAVELRYLTKSGNVGSGVYTNHQQFINDATVISGNPEIEAVWFNLNEIPVRFASNAYRLGAAAVKNEDIVRRKLILVDVEAKKPEEFKHYSATEEEKREASTEAEKIGTVLDEFGIPYALADSGNGFHLLVRVDLQCNEETDGLVHNFLESLQRQVPTSKIDVAVHNRGRVTKLYGTQTRKGRNLPDRPWRLSALLRDCNREPVSADRLQRLIDAAPGLAVEQTVRRNDVSGLAVAADFDIRGFLTHYCIEVRQRQNIFATDVCIIAGRKHSGDSDKSGFYFDGQHLGWHCFSGDCAKYTIKDVIRKLNKTHPPYPKRIWPEKGQLRLSAGRSELPLIDEQTADDPANAPTDWPREAIEGDYLTEYMHLLTEGTQIPPQFVREQLKMVLGALHEGRIGFPGHRNLGTRHYVQLVTDGPQGCKDESWRRILGTAGDEGLSSPWRKILADRGIHVLDGSVLGSGQYVAKELQEKPRCLAVFSEGREVWEKNAHQGSTLESALLKLYDGTSHWTGSLTNKRHGSEDIHLSLTSFFTLDSYRSSFSSKGSGGGGYLSRNVIAYSNRLPYSKDWPERDGDREQKAVEKILEIVPSDECFLGEPAPVWIPEIAPEARELFATFTREIEDPDNIHREYVSRVVDLTKRDLLIRTRYSGNSGITREMVERAIAWGRHQLSLRVTLWPCDRGSQVETMAWTILRAIKRHPPGLTAAKLRGFCHVDRLGSGGQEVFNRAFRALQFGKRIKPVGKTRKGTIVWSVADE